MANNDQYKGLYIGVSIDKAIEDALTKIPQSNTPSKFKVIEFGVSTGGITPPQTFVVLEIV